MMSEKDFVLPGDGWVQVTPCGEFPHAGAGVVQVIDRAACVSVRRSSFGEFEGRTAVAIFV
jgi:hypothetical protein